MATPIKTVLFFLCALMVLRAPPALSVPLASGIDTPGSTADGPDFVLATDDATQTLDGTAEGTDARARIVDNREVAYGLGAKDSEVSAPHSEFGMSSQAAIGVSGSSHNGWLLPAAAVGAGGGALFALLSHGGKQGSSGGLNASGLDVIAGASPGVSVGHGQGGPGDDTPSSVPEPGTLLLMGIGAAAFLARRSGMRA